MSISNTDPEQTPDAYVSSQEDFNEMLKSVSNNIKEYGTASFRSAAYHQDIGSRFGDNPYYGNSGGGGDRSFQNVSTDMTVRSEYNRGDYAHFRPNERVPEGFTQMMIMCNRAYEKVSIVRSVIDMMGDFTTQGIRIVHPNKKIENFHKNWWKTVGGELVSERIANTLYRLGQCPVKKRMGRVSVNIETEWKKSHARKNDIKLEQPKVDKRTIPLGYNILNPASMVVIGGDIAVFAGKPYYGIHIGHRYNNAYNRIEQSAMNDPKLNDIIKSIPEEVRQAIKGRQTVIPLDQGKLEMLFYKKDDWNPWSVPMLASILDNLMMLEKMHLADSSALDGAISQIRLWKLGIYNESNPAQSLLPTSVSVGKLRNILAQVGNGVLDLVWGPELDFKESNSQVHNYLKPEKYQQVMTEIYAGLGVPASLTGGGGSSKGGGGSFNNNLIAMKTMVERLEYGRRVIIDFWNKELKTIQKAMGWRFPAQIVFDYKVLTDEAAQQTVVMNLWERNILSTETLQELAGRDPELENLRLSREQRKMDSGRMVRKTSPFHISEQNQEHDYKKLILQSGGVTPSELGVELDERKEGEQSTLEVQQENQLKVAQMNNDAKITQQKAKPVSGGGDGRPKNSVDTETRKTRVPKQKTMSIDFFNTFLWGVKAQKEIADTLTPFLLDHFSKDSLRSLNKNEVAEAEKFKFRIFCKIEPYSEITKEMVYNMLVDSNQAISTSIIESVRSLSLIFIDRNGREPTLDEMRQMQSSAYSLFHEETNVENND